MNPLTLTPSSDPVQERMRAAYVKFQGRLQAIRHERLDELKSIFRRLDGEHLDAAKKTLDQQ
jgi:hypothetical protein